MPTQAAVQPGAPGIRIGELPHHGRKIIRPDRQRLAKRHCNGFLRRRRRRLKPVRRVAAIPDAVPVAPLADGLPCDAEAPGRQGRRLRTRLDCSPHPWRRRGLPVKMHQHGRPPSRTSLGTDPAMNRADRRGLMGSSGREQLCAASVLARFFESPDHPTVPGRVPRTPWDVGKARLNRTVRHHALRTCHAETFIDDPNRIDAPPAHHTIALPARFRQSAPVPASAGRPTARGGLHPRGWSTHRDLLCQTDAPGPPMSGGPFRQSAPPPFGSCHRRQQSMPEVVVSGGCLNIAAQGGASWQHQDHGEGVQQQAWQICFTKVNHKINERETRLSQNSMKLVSVCKMNPKRI